MDRSVAAELRRKQNRDRVDLFRGRGRLSPRARGVVLDAAQDLTGMRSVNDYWLPQILSEAIEAAETLGL